MMNVSRRSFLVAGACACAWAGLGPTMARVQGSIWQELGKIAPAYLEMLEAKMKFDVATYFAEPKGDGDGQAA